MKTVYVGLSGGVDSSVSAALLKSQGYNVVGVYMKNWTSDVAGVECPWKQDLADAHSAAAKIDIPFKVFDFQAEYKQYVVETMVAEYQSGRTPNPDVMCNQHIKFDLFLKTALDDGADLIATGHYAQTSGDGILRMALDPAKDQTYFLYRVTSQALAHTIFPVGGLTKTKVRQIATDLGLPTAKKPDSQGICFVGEVGIREFLRQYLQVEPGPIIDHATNRVLGTHQGAIFYTLGQRHGLGVGGGQPYFVTGKDLDTNTVFVTSDARDSQLETSEFNIAQTHWMNEAPQPNTTYHLRSRHRAQLIDCTVTQNPDQSCSISLAQPARAITPGQSAVIYDGKTVVGGGIVA